MFDHNAVRGTRKQWNLCGQKASNSEQKLLYIVIYQYTYTIFRALGTRCRRFKSGHPDQKTLNVPRVIHPNRNKCFLFEL